MTDCPAPYRPKSQLAWPVEICIVGVLAIIVVIVMLFLDHKGHFDGGVTWHSIAHDTIATKRTLS